MRPLFSLLPKEVYQISTPRNPRDLHQLHQSISTEFSQSNKFEDWATRYAVEKLANSATAALNERDELQRRLKINADKRKHAKAAKKPRQKIPAEGLQFANHAELQVRAHFSGRHLEDLANTNEKIKRMQGKVKKLEEKISELVTTLHKHSERLAEGKLPARWHTPSRIEEDIGKERAKLVESQAELRKLELQASHIQHLIDPGSEEEEEEEEEEEDLGSDILDMGNLSLGSGEV